MNPAPSIIIFTSFSGIGFGLLFFLGFGFPSPKGIVALIFLTIAYILSIGGLIASTFHLGHPERALKAFTQWKTSWLSREAWLASGALFFMTIYGIGLVFFGVAIGFIGVLGALLSLATVYSTSMIYAHLKTVPRWNNFLTPCLFIVISLSGGGIIAGLGEITLILLLAAGIIQALHWIMGDRAFLQSETKIATATGLGSYGNVKLFEPPHTGSNYLLREFVYVVARKHVSKLRLISLVMMIGLPISLLSTPLNFWISLLAALFHLAGVLVSRWLFFAQAEHVVGLYYGKYRDV